jgi:NAD(P)-dependent dehydrogenase (short-subunit alcohol dehydrogenase family)
VLLVLPYDRGHLRCTNSVAAQEINQRACIDGLGASEQKRLFTVADECVVHAFTGSSMAGYPGVAREHERVAVKRCSSSPLDDAWGTDVYETRFAPHRAEQHIERRLIAECLRQGGGNRVADAPKEHSVVERLFHTVGKEVEIEGLVLCAGTNIPQRRFGELTEERWRTVLGTDLDGAFSCLRAALPQLRETRGHIVVVASVSALWPDQSGAAYQESKAGVLALMRAASYEEHEHGLRFTTIMPGMVLTELIDKRPEPPSDEVRAQMLLPEDVAEVILCALRLPSRACLSELTIVPTALQAVRKT